MKYYYVGSSDVPAMLMVFLGVIRNFDFMNIKRDKIVVYIPKHWDRAIREYYQIVDVNTSKDDIDNMPIVYYGCKFTIGYEPYSIVITVPDLSNSDRATIWSIDIIDGKFVVNDRRKSLESLK
jgi:hypothetical protein